MKASPTALASLFAIVVLSGRPSRAAADAPILLTASLATPIDVVLHWEDRAPGAAEHVVEYSLAADGKYTILGFIPPATTEYKHPRLMPHTRFFYRVRAIYGPASPQVEAVVPPILSDAEYAAAFKSPQDFSWAPPRFNPNRAAKLLISVRDPSGAAAPAALTADFVPSTASGFQLTWLDRAKDSDGYLLERKRSGSPDFLVCAMMPPRTNSFGWALIPPERQASFRIRPFYFGPSSNVVTETTGEGHPPG